MPEMAENLCAYSVKGFVCLVGAIGIVISIFSARNCEFISFVDTDGNPPDRAEDPPFNSALAAHVGIFGYDITTVFNGAGPGTDGCVQYERYFGRLEGYPSLATAQFCSLLAPIFAGFALFACAVDLCVCNFNGSFMIAGLLFATATGLQAGTFTLLADPAFCLEDQELECTTGRGAHLSIGATILYAIAALFMCCAPRADPFCYNFGFGPRRKKVPPPPPPQQPQVIVQPIIIETPNHMDQYHEYDREQEQPKRSNKKASNKRGGKNKKNNLSSNV